MIKLTNYEVQFLNGMRNNCFCDALQDEYPWFFGVVDECNYSYEQGRGVLSSLIKKGLVGQEDNDGESIVYFTEEGKKLFDNANGEECAWGGKLLLKNI